jgi:hypothetical protein
MTRDSFFCYKGPRNLNNSIWIIIIREQKIHLIVASRQIAPFSFNVIVAAQLNARKSAESGVRKREKARCGVYGIMALRYLINTFKEGASISFVSDNKNFEIIA